MKRPKPVGNVPAASGVCVHCLITGRGVLTPGCCAIEDLVTIGGIKAGVCIKERLVTSCSVVGHIYIVVERLVTGRRIVRAGIVLEKGLKAGGDSASSRCVIVKSLVTTRRVVTAGGIKV